MCLMAVVSAIETVGDTSGITKGGAGREATDKEISGATFADGLGTAVAGVFGGLPNTSFSQNVGLIAMTGVMSRHVVTIGAIFLIICGLVPKIGALISTVPINVLGGGVIVMFGMVAAAGVNMLSDVNWNRRNMVIFAVSLSVGLGLQLEPEALQHLPKTAQILLTSGLLPAATWPSCSICCCPKTSRIDGFDARRQQPPDVIVRGLFSFHDQRIYRPAFAAARMAEMFLAQSASPSPLNTAEPATSTLAPAAATSGAVSGVTPPSISMSTGRSPIIFLTTGRDAWWPRRGR
jgi:hypothetical protein